MLRFCHQSLGGVKVRISKQAASSYYTECYNAELGEGCFTSNYDERIMVRWHELKIQIMNRKGLVEHEWDRLEGHMKTKWNGKIWHKYEDLPHWTDGCFQTQVRRFGNEF